MTELLSLRGLLTTWGLPELFARFQDENIGVEELKMMKSQHIAELLRSHKLGTRIRFEYHFERWRRDQNKPLMDTVIPNYTHTHYTCPTPSHTTHLLWPEAREATVATNKNLRTCATNTAAVSYVSVATNTTTELTFKPPRLSKTPTPPPPPPPPVSQQLPPPPPSLPLVSQLSPKPPPLPLPTSQSKLLPSAPLPPLSKPSSPTPLPAIKNLLREIPRRSVRQVSSSVLEESAMVEIPKALMLSPTTAAATTITATTPTVTSMTASTTPTITTTSTCTVRRFSVPFTNDPDDEHLDNGPILHIINSSGAKGQSLLDYYAEHKKFTNTQRSLLIQLIVNFFDMHEYHLSLKLSHNLEEQILRLFPSERLYYYRTEKRGKIYVKFCNMKRYKRERPAAKRKCLDAEDGAVANGVAVDGGMVMEPEVGIEYDDDEDDNVDFISWQHLMQQTEGEVQVKTEMLGESDYQ